MAKVAATGTPGMSDNAEFVWHHDFHEKADERLCFLKLSVSPSFGRRELWTEVGATLHEANVLSYAVWPIFGEFDCIVRAWLPQRQLTPNELKERLERNVRGRTIEVHEFTVDTIVCHWMFSKGLDLKLEDIPARYLEGAAGASIPQKLQREYRDQGALFKMASRRRSSMKFFAELQVHGAPSATRIQQFVQKLMKSLSEAPVTDYAVYEGLGTESLRYVISGRVNPIRYSEDLDGKVLEAVGDLAAQYWTSARTSTHLVANSYPAIQREQLRSPTTSATVRSTAADIRELLAVGESDTLEVKGSGFVDVVDGPLRGERPNNPERTHDIAKAIAALANTAGGTVVVGALESKHYPNLAEPASFLLKSIAEVGGFRITGVQFEPAFRKHRWDGYMNRLADQVGSLINFDIASWTFWQKVECEAATLCLIEVRRPGRSIWAKPSKKSGAFNQFYVRRQSKSVPIEGPAVDAWKEQYR